jgi:hypothetical protein
MKAIASLIAVVIVGGLFAAAYVGLMYLQVAILGDLFEWLMGVFS